jgi:sugar/nucleoside kinase (ribokinase family)
MKIVAFSAFCIDYFPEQCIIRPGGNSFNFSIHSKQMGAKQVSAIGFLGNDSSAELILKYLRENKVDISHLYLKDGETASNKIYNTSDGERYSKSGEWNGGVMDNYILADETWDFIIKHDVWAIPCLDKNLESAIKLKSPINKIVVDFLHLDDVEFISRYIDSLDIAFVSTQQSQLEKLKELSVNRKKLVVVTMGAEGSVAFNSGKTIYQKAIPVRKVVDTTECGDTFQAAFTYTFFNGSSIEKALKAGATEAEKVIHNYGGISDEDYDSSQLVPSLVSLRIIPKPRS